MQSLSKSSERPARWGMSARSPPEAQDYKPTGYTSRGVVGGWLVEATIACVGVSVCDSVRLWFCPKLLALDWKLNEDSYALCRVGVSTHARFTACGPRLTCERQTRVPVQSTSAEVNCTVLILILVQHSQLCCNHLSW